MSVIDSEIKWKQSATQDDTANNGGKMISDDVVSTYLPDITGTERAAGITRYRKMFAKQENKDGSGYKALTLGAAKVFLRMLSPGEDRYRLKEGTDADIQTAAAGYSGWCGVGSLDQDYIAGQSAIDVDCEAADGFGNAQEIIIFDATDPDVFEIITVNTVSWSTFKATLNLATVTQMAWDRNVISISTPVVTSTTVSKVGIDLGAANSKVGLLARVVSGAGAGQVRRIISNATETFSINYAWDPLDLPDDTSVIEIIKTVIAQLAPLGDIIAEASAWVETNALADPYDETTYPLLLFPEGTTSDDFTITFTAESICTVTDGLAQVIASGVDITAGPIKPVNGTSFYFELDEAGFNDVTKWVAGDTIEFTTKHSAEGLWLKEIVGAGAAAHAGNRWDVGIIGDTA